MAELIIVLTIIGLISAIAVPRFANAIRHERINAAARRVAADLNMAQSQADMTSSTVTVTFMFATNQYQIPGIADLTRSLGPYTVNLAEEPYKVKLASSDFGGILKTSGTSQISYNSFGLPNTGGSVTVVAGAAAMLIVVDPVTGKAQIQ